MDGLARAEAATVRRVIADEWLRADAIAPVLGSVTLRTHQLDAARRLHRIIDQHGGALLCDEVGLGKTYVALAVARSYSLPLVVAPASLRTMWLDAADRSGVAIRFVSLESLSRSLPDTTGQDLIIVDEAHHFRTPSSARYRSLATLAARSRLLLVSATPLHNRNQDIIALIALFLGSAARSMSVAEMARFVLRRDQREAPDSFPRVREPAHLRLPHDSRMLEALLALPPAVPPKDGGVAAAMVTHTLVRLWASSGAALREGLRRRFARAVGLRLSLEAGRYPTRRELAAWTYAEGAVQLGFSELLASHESAECRGLLDAVMKHERALSELLVALPADSSEDAARVEHLRALRQRHADAGIVAFSQFSATVEMYYRHLRRSGETAMLTSHGARIASGAITRREALERFAPAASNVRAPAPGERITLLIATDLLSEGVNLQDASVVAHLDLPWTAATLEQRVGRVARLGSRCREVFVYCITPPAPSEELLRAEAIIRRKTTLADAAVGASRIPPLFPRTVPAHRSDVEAAETIRRTLASWAQREAVEDDDRPVWAAVSAERDAVLALVTVRGRVSLLAGDAMRLSTDCHVVCGIVDAAGGNTACIPFHDAAAAHACIKRWIEDEEAALDAGQTQVGSTALARRLAARLTQCLSSCPLHQRAQLSDRVTALRERIQEPFTLGIEYEIDEVLRSTGQEDLVPALERVIIGERRRDRRENKSCVRAMLILRNASGLEPGAGESKR